MISRPVCKFIYAGCITPLAVRPLYRLPLGVAVSVGIGGSGELG